MADLHTLDLDFGTAAPVRQSHPAAERMGGLARWQHLPQRPRRKSQAGLVMPYLQVQDAAGRWKTVNKDMGMPAGKPKTIAVPVEFLSASRKVRIVTNLCVYWDEIFLSEGASDAACDSRSCHTFRLGRSAFSRILGIAHRPAAQTARYILLRPCFPDFVLESHAGSLYKIRPCGRTAARRRRPAGDHGLGRRSDAAIRRRSPCSARAAGWTRDFLLKVDGWAKDRDPNTAFSSSVRSRCRSMGCPAIRIRPTNIFRDDAAHDATSEQYNTRPALRLIRPLRTELTDLAPVAAVLNAAYVAALPSATIFYVANVLLHVVLGARRSRRAVLAVAAKPENHAVGPGRAAGRIPDGDGRHSPIIAGSLLGAYRAGGVVGLAMLLPRWALARVARRTGDCRGWRCDSALAADRIRNPETVPLSMS